MTSDSKLKAELCLIVFLLVIALFAPFGAYCGWIKPANIANGEWFSRSGSITSIFSILAQYRANSFLEKIRGGTFAESWEDWFKFIKKQEFFSFFATLIAIAGALIWGYGDLLIK
jgi:hypothetical protein